MVILCLSAVITTFGTLDMHSALLKHVRMTLELIGIKYSNCCQSDVTKLSTHILLKYLGSAVKLQNNKTKSKL